MTWNQGKRDKTTISSHLPKTFSFARFTPRTQSDLVTRVRVSTAVSLQPHSALDIIKIHTLQLG